MLTLISHISNLKFINILQKQTMTRELQWSSICYDLKVNRTNTSESQLIGSNNTDKYCVEFLLWGICHESKCKSMFVMVKSLIMFVKIKAKFVGNVSAFPP